MNGKIMDALVALNAANTGVGTLHALISTRMYAGLAVQRPTFPYVVLASVGGTSNDVFGSGVQWREPRISFTIISKTAGLGELYDIDTAIKALYDSVTALAIDAGITGAMLRESDLLYLPLSIPGHQGTLNYRVQYGV